MAYDPTIPALNNYIGDDIPKIMANFAELAGSRIVEMGSNSNGSYVRWENGLQVCFIRRFGEGPSPVEWVLPAAFVDETYAVVGTSYDWPFLVVTVDWRDTTANKVRFRKWSHDGTEFQGTIRHISPIAIGRWK